MPIAYAMVLSGSRYLTKLLSKSTVPNVPAEEDSFSAFPSPFVVQYIQKSFREGTKNEKVPLSHFYHCVAPAVHPALRL